MSIWIFLWFILAIIILGATSWSTVILYRQKSAWERFARMHKMVYRRGKLMESPTVEGSIGQAIISIFSAQRQNEDERKSRMMSIMEITLPHGMIDGGAAGTSEMLPFMHTLDTLRPMEISGEHWKPDYVLMGRNQDALKHYFTPDRVDALAHILILKNADILVMFDGSQAVVRVETVDPMLHPAKLDKIIKRILADGEKLAISEGEVKRIQAEAKPDDVLEETSPEESQQPDQSPE